MFDTVNMLSFIFIHIFTIFLAPFPPFIFVFSVGKISSLFEERPFSASLLKDPLEMDMETHSSILAWEIPWTKDPGGLQSMGSQNQT